MAYYFSEQDGILTFTINRPEKRNAINDEVMEGFKEVITYVHNHVRESSWKGKD